MIGMNPARTWMLDATSRIICQGTKSKTPQLLDWNPQTKQAPTLKPPKGSGVDILSFSAAGRASHRDAASGPMLETCCSGSGHQGGGKWIYRTFVYVYVCVYVYMYLYMYMLYIYTYV